MPTGDTFIVIEPLLAPLQVAPVADVEAVGFAVPAASMIEGLVPVQPAASVKFIV